MNYKALLILLFGLTVMYSCEDCPGCENRITEARIKIKFKAVSSRIWVQEVADSLNTLLVINRSLLDSIPDLQDSLQAPIDQLESDSTKYADWLKWFIGGKAFINNISGENVVGNFVFQDTIINTSFSLPLNMNRDESVYYFDYHGLSDTLKILYKREVTQNLDGVRMKIYDLSIDNLVTTFDSVKVRCIGLECSNRRSSIEVYF